MEISIICSKKSDKLPKNLFEKKQDTRFANVKFIPHITDDKEACTVCGKKCFWCRGKYNLDFSKNIAEIIYLDDVNPLFLDNPTSYLSYTLKKTDLLIAIGIHEDILVELPRLMKKSNIRALLVPCEDSNWISRWSREETIKECIKYGIQYDFPKPFCALKHGKFNIINEFIDEFKVGKPKFKFYVDDEDIIKKVDVIISAPCGNGYNVAKHLVGKKLGEEAKKTVAKYWHSYPCMGGMKIDPEIGDTILHIGGYLHYNALEKAEIVKINKVLLEEEMA